jgi:cytidylate kinase
MPEVIAIDGPAASGKSSVARAVAQKLGWTFVNTGNMYRAVTWAVLDIGIDPSDPAAITAALDRMGIDFKTEAGETSVCIGGKTLHAELTEDRVNKAVSLVASVPAVRQKLVAGQRALTRLGSLVMEGRDIGSVVFPHSRFKFYVDASEEVRTARRQAQGHVDQIGARDRMDSSRKTSPLITAPDAIVIDSSHLSLAQVIDRVLADLATRGLTPPTA